MVERTEKAIIIVGSHTPNEKNVPIIVNLSHLVG